MYRIVGFEVDPRSVSINSLEINSDKQEKTENKKIEPGSQCVFPQQVEVAELQKGSELFLISYVYCTAVRLPDYCNSIFWMLLPALLKAVILSANFSFHHGGCGHKFSAGASV